MFFLATYDIQKAAVQLSVVEQQSWLARLANDAQKAQLNAEIQRLNIRTKPR